MALLVLQSADPAAAQLPGFGVRQIRQSNPLIGAVNTITVALEANDDAELSSAKSAVLTLSNLRNLDRAQGRTTTTQGWSLPLHPVQGGNGGHALFCVAQAGHNASALVLTSAPSSLRLALCPRAQMQPRVVYAFSFTVVNPEEEQDGGTVFVSAQGSAPAANIDVTPLVNSPAAPGTPARRLLKGATPFRVRRARVTNHTVSQSVPIVGKTNELTVTLATNWQLEAHDTLAISITGLNGTAQPAGALQLGTPVDSFVRGVFCYQGEPDVVEFQVAGSGEGVVRLEFCPNKVLPAEHPHLFSFQVLNGLAPQAAPSVSIVHVAATGGVALAPVPAVSVDVTGGLTGAAAPIRGVPGGSAPLLLIVPRFKVRGMSQSNPVVSGTNVLTVSLRSNVDVLSSDGAIINITHLVGASAVSPIDVDRVAGGNGADLLFCAGSQVSAAGWVADSGQGARVELSLCPYGHLRAETDYAFSITVTNPPAEQLVPPTVMIGATEGWLKFATEAMTASSNAARGLPSGATPLKIVRPRFLVAKAGQTNPAAGMSNVISLTLTPNVDITAAERSAITFTGIPTQAQYPAQQSTRISLLPGVPGNRNDGRNRILGLLSPLPPPATAVDAGNWDAREGILTFFVAYGKKLSGNLQYIISFEINNRDTAVGTPDIRVEASANMPFPVTSMLQPFESAGGVANGANAFFVNRPEFVVRSIWQATPEVAADNTIVMTLSPNFNLFGAQSSRVFISGLVGSGLSTPVRMQSSLPLFCLDGNSTHLDYASFDQATATLNMQLCSAAQFLAEQVVVVTFNLTNPSVRQASPDIAILATGTYSFLASPMTKSGAVWNRVTRGHDPLMVVAILQWVNSSETRTPSKGGAQIVLGGKVFPSSFGIAALPYNCSFELDGVYTLTSATVYTDSSIICSSPFLEVQSVMNFQLQYNGRRLDFGVPTALTHDNILYGMSDAAPNPFQVSDGWESIAADSPLQGPADGGTVISIVGYGFDWRKGYKCRFFRSDQISDTAAVVRSKTLLSCATPVWGLHHAAATTSLKILRVNGPGQEVSTLFTNGTVEVADESSCHLFPGYGRCAFTFYHVWTMSGRTATFDLPPSQPTVFSAAGGQALSVSGMGFDDQTKYACRFVFRYGPFTYGPFVSPRAVRFVNHTLIVCDTPVWEYYYTQEAVMELVAAGQDAPVQLATQEQHVSFAFKEMYYALQPSMGPAAGGYSVTVRGFGFDQSKGYRVRLNGTPQAGLVTQVRGFSEVSFVMPKQTGSQSAVQVTLQFDNVNPIRQGEFVRLLPGQNPAPDNTSWSGPHGDCSTYVYGQPNWRQCQAHQVCAACATTCASECGFLDGEDGMYLNFSLFPKWVRVDTPVMDPSQKSFVIVEAYGVGPPHNYFCAYPDGPLVACTQTGSEPFLSCPSPVDAYDLGLRYAELRIYQGADAASAVRIESPANPNITLVHSNRPPVFHLSTAWIDTHSENAGTYDQVVATGISKGERDGSPDNRENGQNLTFSVAYAPKELFQVAPEVSIAGSLGRLTFRIKDNRNGLARIWITLRDDGGTDYGGVDMSETRVVNLNVRSQAQAPEVILLPNPVQIPEGGGRRIIHGFVNIALHLETHALESLEVQVQPRSPEDAYYFLRTPRVLFTGDLEFELKEYAFGTADFTMAFVGIDGASGSSVTVNKNLTMQIDPVNQAPYFRLPLTTVSINESRAWDYGVLELQDAIRGILPRSSVPQNSSVRGEDWGERTQNISFHVTVLGQDADIVRVDEPALAPSVALHGAYPLTQGTLVLVTRPNANGQIVLNLSAVDTANGSSAVQQLAVNVLPVNDAPRIDANCSVSPRISCQSSCARYPYDVPAVGTSSAGVLLSFGAPGGMTNTSHHVGSSVDMDCVNSSTVHIQVDENCVNCPDDGHADGFEAQPCDGRRFSLAGLFLSSPSRWDSPDELGQNLTFDLTQIGTNVDEDTGYGSLFQIAPQVRQADGRLTFCLRQDANGNATFHVVVMDDGGDERGGIATSHTTVLIIDVVPVNQAPLFNVPGPLFTFCAGTGNQTLQGFASKISKGNKGVNVADREASQLATFHVALDLHDPEIFASSLTIDQQGTLRVELAQYQVGTAQSNITLHDSGGVYGDGRDSSVNTPVLMAVVDSVLVLKMSIPEMDALDTGRPVDLLQHDVADVVSSMLSLRHDWIHVGVIDKNITVRDLVCGPCGTDVHISGFCSNVNGSDSSGESSPCHDSDASPFISRSANAVSFYVRVLLPDLNYTWAERVPAGHVPGPWNGMVVDWAQHMLHSNCANQPSFDVGGSVLARNDGVAEGLGVAFNKTAVFYEIDSTAAHLTMRSFLTSVVAPKDVPIDSHGREMVSFVLQPIAHKLFGREEWTVDGTDGGMMHNTPTVVPTFNSSQAFRFRTSGECREADLVIFPKPFWNGRVIYRLSMHGWSEDALFELELLPVNQIPSFSIPGVVFVREDAGSVSLPSIAVDVAAGPDIEDEGHQALAFSLTLIEGSSDVVDVHTISLKIVNSTATLQLETIPNGNGVLVFNVSLHDYDLMRNDNKTSPIVRMRLEVLPVNDAPVVAFNCSFNESSPYSMFPVGSGEWWQNATLRSCLGGVDVADGCRDFGPAACAMLIHVDENCDDCVAREPAEAGGGGTCFVAPHFLRSRPALHSRENEDNQTLSFDFELLSGVDMLVAQGPKFAVMQEDDTLKICLAEDMNGKATYRIIASDDGGRLHSGQNESDAIILQLDVHPVNQAPSFLVCCESMITLWTGGVQVLDSFAHRILKGRPNADGSDREGFQQATFHVVTGLGTDKLFAALPSVSSSGTLTASLLPAVPGMFNFSVFLVDDAGTYGKGRNTSDPQNVSLAVVDSYVAIRISLDPKGLKGDLAQMERHAREAVLSVLQVAHEHWVAMCGNHSLFNGTICQDESARAAFAREGSNGMNSLALRTIYVLAPSAEKAVEYSLKARDIGQALQTHVTRTLKVEALPLRRNWQQNPHFDINRATLQPILEVDLNKWSLRGSNASIVRHGFLQNVSAPQHVPYNLEAQEHLVFHLQPLGHRLFGRANWTMDGTDGGLMVYPPNVTADCRPLCQEATLTVAPKEFWNGEVLYEVHMLTTHVKEQVVIFVEPVNQEPRLTVSNLIYLLEDGDSNVSQAACAIISGPPVEDEQAQHMEAFVVDPNTAETLGAVQVSGQGACVDISVSLNGSQVAGNTSVHVVVSDSGTYLANADMMRSTPVQLRVQTVRVNASLAIQENSDCTADAGCVHPNFASDIVGLEAGGQQITYTSSKISGESVDRIHVAVDGTLTIYSVFDKIGVAYFRITLEANGSIPTAFVNRIAAINVTFVNQAPRFTLMTNGSALLVNEQEPVPLQDDADFDVGYGGCHTYSLSYEPTEEIPANSGFCVYDDACLACTASCQEECGTLGGVPTVIVGARNVLSGAPHIAREEVQNVTFSVVRLEASPHILEQCNFDYPPDIHAQDAMEEEKMLLQGDPYFSADGMLRFHITPYRFGVVPFNVTLTEESNLSTTKLMCFSVMPVNQPPTFALRQDVVHVAESFDGGVVACDDCVNIARDMDAGPLEQHQQLSFVVTAVEARIPSYPTVAWEKVNDTQVFGSGGQRDMQLFESLSSVSIDSQGTLSFRLRAKRYGKVRFEVALRDSGGIERGGVDSVVHMLVLDVMPVNDAPTFVLVTPQFYFSEQTAEQKISKMEIGSQVSVGPWAESIQTPSFRVERAAGPPGVILQPNASLGSPDALGFRVLLDIRIAPHRFGNITLNVTIVDDGKRDLGGQDSTTYSVVIVVAPVNNAPTLLLMSDQLLVNRNSRCYGPDIFGGRRTTVVDGKVACSAAWQDPGSAPARLQDLGAGACNRQGDTLEHEHLGFLSKFSVGIFEDGANGCPNLAMRDACCIGMCVETSAPDFLGYPACGCEAQTGVFNMTALDPLAEGELFEEAPRFLFPCGVLYFKLKQDVSGKVGYNLSLSDGVATSPTATFSITVLKANIAPYFEWSIPPNIEVLEDSGEQSFQVAKSVSADAANGAREPEQSVTFMLEPGFSGLFAASAQPRIDISSGLGQLVFLAAADEYGNQTYTVSLVDDGGLERGGVNSYQRQLSITVISVNDAPHFVLQPFIEIVESSGVNLQAGFASSISPGAANEAAVQQISFTIDYVSAPDLFARAPSISPDGTLTLVPRKAASGYAVVDVRLIDNGDHGGQLGHRCTSATHAFTVNVKAVNDVPGFAIPWKVTCDTTAYLQEGVCECPAAASVLKLGTTPVACGLHNTSRLGLPYACPTQTNPEQECIFAGREGVSNTVAETVVTVLEDSGQHYLTGFAQSVSPEAGRVGGSMMRFYQTTWDAEIEMLQGFREDVLGHPGLEYASAYTHSADGKYVYAVEQELNTLAVFEQLDESLSWDVDGAAAGRKLAPVDRLAEGQDRVRFNLNTSLSSEAVCGLTEVWIGQQPHVVAASGCQALSDFAGIVSNRSCISEACDSACCHDLHQGLVGHWEMSADFLYGRHRVNTLTSGDEDQRMEFSNNMYWQYKRDRITSSRGTICREERDTQVGPATIRDLSSSEALGAAIFRGAGLKCKTDSVTDGSFLKDWDQPAADALSAANFIMNNGELEAMQFDGKLNLGLLVAEDVNENPVNKSIPSAAFSVDVWFTVDADDADANSDSRDRGLIAAFLPGILDEDDVLQDDCMAGWRLSYRARATDGASLDTVLTFELVANNKSVTHAATTTNATVNQTNMTEPESIAVLRTTSPSMPLVAGHWYHVLAVSDMHELKIYLNGTLLNANERVTCATCKEPVYRRNYHPHCRGEKTPLTIGTFCASPDCSMDSNQWSHHSGALFNARVWSREMTGRDAERLYAMHAARLTPVYAANYWVVGREQDLWPVGTGATAGKGSSPGNGTAQAWCTTMPVAPSSMLGVSSTLSGAARAAAVLEAAASAKITLRGRFAPNQAYTVQFRDYANTTLQVSTRALNTGVEFVGMLVFDLAGTVWPNGYSSTIISLVGPDGLPVWQRVCLKSSCGLPAAGSADRKKGLHPGLRGFRLRFAFTTDSRALQVSITETSVSFARIGSLFPKVDEGGKLRSVFLGAASSTQLRIDGVDYLAVANFWDGESHQVPSRLMRLDASSPSEPRFELVQSIVSNGARQWAMVDVSRLGLQFSTVLALANYLAPSVLIPWQASQPATPLDTANSVELGAGLGASALKVFYVNGWPYIVLAVFADPGTANGTLNVHVPSRIVRLGKTLNDTHADFGIGGYAAATAPASGLAVAVTQELETAAAHDVEVFRANGRLYLFFAVNLAESESLLYMSEDGDAEPRFTLLQRVMVHGHAAAVRAFVVEAPPADFGAAVAATFSAAQTAVHVVVGRSRGQALVLRFNGTNLLALPDSQTLPLDWAGGQMAGVDDGRSTTLAVLPLSPGPDGSFNTSHVVLGQYEVSWGQASAPYSPSQVLQQTRVGVRGLEAPSSVLEVESGGKTLVVVASLLHEQLSIFERSTSQLGEVLVYHSLSGTCGDVLQFPQRLDDYPEPQAHSSGWSMLVQGWPGMRAGPCIFAASPARGAVAAFCFDQSSVPQCVDIMFDGQEVDGVHPKRLVDGLAGAVALAVSNDNSSIYVAGGYDHAVAVVRWNDEAATFEFIDRLKQGERLIHSFRSEIDDTVPVQGDTPEGFFRVQLPLELSKYLTVEIPPGYPQAGSMVTFELEPAAWPGGVAYVALPPPAPLECPARLGGNQRNWSLNARDTEHWTLEDGSRYMAIASSAPGADPDGLAMVVVLHWNEDVKRFDVIQELGMHDMAPAAVCSFEVADTTGVAWRYLAVGSSLRHGDHRASINVYRWDPAVSKFVFHHGAPATLVGGHPNDPLTGEPLPVKLSIEKLVHWELDGQHYLAAAVSQVVFAVGYLDEQQTVTCEDRLGRDWCVSNVSLQCQVWDGNVTRNVSRYDWERLGLVHSISNCSTTEVAEVCSTESRIEDGQVTTGFRPRATSSYPFDVDFCVTGRDIRCATNITGPRSSPVGNCSHVNVTRCTDEHDFVVCTPHFKWITDVRTSQRSYVYRWNAYGSTVLEDGKIGHGSGLQIFQILDAPRTLHVASRLLDMNAMSGGAWQQQGSGPEGRQLVMFASFGHSGTDGNVLVFRFDSGIYNPYLRGQMGLLTLVQSVPCDHPTALALHTIADPRFGLEGTLMAVATSTAPVFDSNSAAQADVLASYTPTLLFYKWSIETSTFEAYVVRVEEDAMKPRGAVGLHFFEDSGELYLAVAQGVCFVGQRGDDFDPFACEHDVLPGEIPGQPLSRVLQFDRVEQDFGEILALTDASNVALRGMNVPNDELREHQEPLRIAAGRNREWETIVVDGRTLLVAASETRGALVYEFEFDHVVGLAGVSSIGSNGTVYEDGRSFERIFAASRLDGAVLSLLHDKSAPSDPLDPGASVNRSLLFDWKAVLATTPLTVRRDLVTRGGGGVMGLQAPGGIRVQCEQRRVKVAHRDFREQGICYIDVRSIADRAELPCGVFAPKPAPRSFLRERLPADDELVLARDPVCQPVVFKLQEIESTNALLFEADGMPEMAPNGTMSFRLRDMQYGVSRQRIVLVDAGGRESLERLVTIEVLTVNHPPVFTLNDIYGGRDNVLGDQVLVFAPMVSPGASHEVHQNLTWRFSYTNQNRFNRPPELAVVQAGGDPLSLVGIVTFSIKSSSPFESEFRVVLVDDGRTGTADGSNNTSTEGTFKLTVLFNNNPPKVLSISERTGLPMPTVAYDSDDADAPPVVHTREDQGLVSLSLAFEKGYAREAGQRVHFELVNVETVHSVFTADRLFSSFSFVIPPSGVIRSPAELAFETAKGYNGRFLINMLIADDGGTQHFGNNRSLFSFVLSVQPQYSFPSFAKFKDLHELEAHEPVNTVRESVLGNFSAMPDDEHLRPLKLDIITNDAPWLFSEGPSFRLDGSVAFTLAPQRSGTAKLVVGFRNDVGILAPSGMWVEVQVHVAEINSAPTAKLLPEIAVVEQDTLLEQQLVGAIFDVLPGPFREEWNSQKVSFRVSFTTSATSLFASPPAVRATYSVMHQHGGDELPYLPPHNLTFTTSPGVHGVAELSLVPYDDGGVMDGGIDVGETLRTTLKVYPRPRVRYVHPRVGSFWGSVAVTIHGESFGSAYSRGYWIGMGTGAKYGNVSVLFGDAQCENVEVVSDSELRCIAPPGRGCTNVSVTISDGSLTRTGHLPCGYVYTEIIFGGVQQEGQGILALGPEQNDGPADPPSNATRMASSALVYPLQVSKSVLALQVRSDLQLFVGGTFMSMGGVKVNHIARYDWREVHKLGNGVDGAVHALVQLQGGDLLAAGVFTKAFLGKGSAVATGGLAVWDGSVWSPLGCTMSGSYFAAAVNGSLLYVAGRIKDTCGIPTDGIALWDSHRWRTLGSGITKGAVHAITLHHDFVYAGGSFVEAGGREASRVARWDGADWHPLGFLNGDVHSLAVFGEYLFAGGDFTMAGSKPCSHLARFYSGDWVQVGGGVNGPVLSLQPLNSCLYFGGSYSQIYPQGGGGNGSSSEGRPARLAKWCLDEQVFEEVATSGGQQLSSVRAMALPPLHGHCSASVAVC